eukprot:3168803-Rhodomonas_salina.1
MHSRCNVPRWHRSSQTSFAARMTCDQTEIAAVCEAICGTERGCADSRRCGGSSTSKRASGPYAYPPTPFLRRSPYSHPPHFPLRPSYAMPGTDVCSPQAMHMAVLTAQLLVCVALLSRCARAAMFGVVMRGGVSSWGA